VTANEYSDPEFVKLREKVQSLEIAVARLQEQELASDRALVIANQSLQHSQAVSNEWRKENIDQRSLYPTISKMEGMFATESSERRSLENRIIKLENAQSTDSGKSTAFDAVWVKAALIISAIGTLFAIAYRAITGK
jgi:hypothetical protein